VSDRRPCQRTPQHDPLCDCYVERDDSRLWERVSIVLWIAIAIGGVAILARCGGRSYALHPSGLGSARDDRCGTLATMRDGFTVGGAIAGALAGGAGTVEAALPSEETGGRIAIAIGGVGAGALAAALVTAAGLVAVSYSRECASSVSP
jgi:hypothetical protein